ncbi:hypothetical protein [Terriglobus sp.]|uniref:hypothetical protein n=1 Tax=Terriglobus sp. TaxID=1889013 RepID=UPI003B00CD85
MQLRAIATCALLAVCGTLATARGQKSDATTGSASNARAPEVARGPHGMPLLVSTYRVLDVAQLQPNAPVVLEVRQRWAGPGCTLSSGATVQGHVSEVTRRGKLSPNASFELVLTAADCNGVTSTPVSLLTASVLAPGGGTTGQTGVVEAPPLADSPLAINGGFRSVNTASNLNNYSPRETLVLPGSVQFGDVIHIPNVALSVGTGPHGGSVVTARKHDLRLERGTVMVLVAVEQPGRVVATVANSSGVSGSLSAIPPGPAPTNTVSSVVVPDVTDATEVCSEGCSVIPAHQAVGETAGTVRSLPLRSLGYAPHDKRLMTEFNRETTVTFLDNSTLLCTFDPHYLREHDTYGQDGARTVRAVLVDAHSLSVRRVVEWRVRGNGAYLWRAGDGHVLVHMGNSLQLLDSNLRMVHKLRLDGRVAFVTVSPAGDRIAVGTIRERYSEDVHRQLAADLAQEPEEPVDVRVLDGALQPLAASERSTQTPAPVLDATGELRLTREGAGRWKLSNYEWDRKQTTIATLRSACRPEISVPASGMTFVVGCTSSGAHWYRMLRRDGRPVLKADSPSDELMQTSDEAAADRFAVRVVRASHSLSPGQEFSRADLTSEVIGVYRATDGKPVSTITANDFTLGRDTYALSPTGDTVVLAGTKELYFYPLPGSAVEAH